MASSFHNCFCDFQWIVGVVFDASFFPPTLLEFLGHGHLTPYATTTIPLGKFAFPFAIANLIQFSQWKEFFFIFRLPLYRVILSRLLFSGASFQYHWKFLKLLLTDGKAAYIIIVTDNNFIWKCAERLRFFVVFFIFSRICENFTRRSVLWSNKTMRWIER